VKVDKTRVSGRHGQRVNTNGARTVAREKAGPPLSSLAFNETPAASTEIGYEETGVIDESAS